VRAAVCYVVPLLPALGLLLRERSDRFLRLHAARALVYFGLLAMAQLALYAILVLLGGVAPPDGPMAMVLGLVFYVLFATLGLGSFLLWLALLRDAMAERFSRFPLLSGAAEGIERLVALLRQLPT